MSLTDPELHSLHADLAAFLRLARYANVEPVSRQESQWARRMLAGGAFSGGRCRMCGKAELHVHAV